MTAAQALLGPAEWHRRVWRLAMPIMIANVSTPLLGLVDTAVIGHLEHAYYLGAVAVGALIFSFLFWGFGFLRMSTTALVAQATGAGRPEEVEAVTARALALALVIGLSLILLQAPIRWAALGLMETSPEVAREASRYFGYRIWGAPATLANYVILGCFLGLQRAGLALALQIILNGANIALDLAFVVGMGWGVAGVAAASAIAEYIALAAGIMILRRLPVSLPGLLRPDRFRDVRAFGRLMAVNRDIFIRTLCLIAGLAWFTAQGAAMGNVVLAANAVLFNFFTFTGYALDGFANAAEALVGGAIGAGDSRGFRDAVRASTFWAGGTAVLISLVYFAAGPTFIDALTSIPEVRTAARAYLPWAAVLPVVSVWAFQYDGIFIGATRGAAMRNAMIISLAIFLAACWVVVPLMGNHGLWLAFAGFLAMRGLTLGLAYPALARSI